MMERLDVQDDPVWDNDADYEALAAALAVFGDESPEPFEARPAIEPPGRAGGKQP